MLTVLAMLAVVVTLLLPIPTAAQNPNLEVIHHPSPDTSVFMPYVPAIKIKSGKILWLSGNTALPVYHDHPHRREEVLKYMPNDLEAQTRAAMDGIKQTLEASGASFKDVVHIFVLRARPRMGDDRQGRRRHQLVLPPVQPQADVDQHRGAGAGRARAAHRDPGRGGGGLSRHACYSSRR